MIVGKKVVHITQLYHKQVAMNKYKAQDKHFVFQ